MRRTIAAIAVMSLAALFLAACGQGSSAGRQGPGGGADGSRGRFGGGAAMASRLDVLRSGASDAGFARALAVRRFEFPRDYGPHSAYRHEWWYFTGHLQAADGERFGFEVTFFRVALAPLRAAAPEASRDAQVPGETSAEASGGASTGTSTGASGVRAASDWRARQIYVAHFAVTDVRRRTFHSTQRFARDALGLAGAQAAPFRVWLDGWSVAEQGATAGQKDAAAGKQGAAVKRWNAAEGRHDTAAGRQGTAGEWTLRVADPAYGLTLQLRPLSAPVLNGDRGLSVKSSEPAAASYYYSIPRLAVRGQIVRGSAAGDGAAAGSAHALDVSGTAWLDREWGSGSLGPHQQGWDWFALQFADGGALMFYALRDDGGARDPHSAGTWIAPDGSSRPLASSDVRIDVLDHWTSPHGARYPSRWRIRIGSLGLDVTATPVLADQELDTTPRYWEGDVDVSGARDGRPVSGKGYVELVGYARG